MIPDASRKHSIDNPIGKKWAKARSHFLVAASYKMVLVVL